MDVIKRRRNRIHKAQAEHDVNLATYNLHSTSMVVVQAEDIFLQLGSVFPVELIGFNGHRVSSVLPGWLIPTLDYKTNIYKISQFAFLSLFAEV